MYVADNDSCGPTKKFTAPDGSSLVEYRSTGAQTVVPPSVLKLKDGNGLEPVEWQEHSNPAHVSQGSVLQQHAAEVASAVVLIQHYPAQGERNELAKALSGTLLRMPRWDVGRVERFIHAVATHAGDEEVENRVLVPRMAAERLKAKSPVLGSPRLERIVGWAVTDRICRWCGGIEQRHNETTILDTGHLETRHCLLSSKRKGVRWSREGRIIFDFAREIRGRPDSQEKAASDFLPEAGLSNHRG